VITAEHGTITNEPRQITLDRPYLERHNGNVRADRATFFLSQQNQVDRVLAEGNVTSEARSSSDTRTKQEQASQIQGHADQAEFLFAPGEDLLRTATMSGHVHVEESGVQTMLGDAGRTVLDFAGQNELKKVHAVDAVRLRETKATTLQQPGVGNSPQDFELTAPAINFTIADGRILQHAVTEGAAQITIEQPQDGPNAPQQTLVTAAQFDADFGQTDGRNHLVRVHGAPNARIVNSSPGKPERVSVSDSVVATFLPQGGIEAVTQTGNVVYTDGANSSKQMQAWADSARYTPADQILLLQGSPRVASSGMATTASRIRINRTTGDALAEGDVKSTYSQLKEQPDGALLASSSPIHVTSQTMTAHSNGGAATYSGKVRLWQDSNVIEAPSVQFDRDHRSVTAQGSTTQPVQTMVVEPLKVKDAKRNSGIISESAAASPIAITGTKLTYTDSERKAHYEGGVVAKGPEFTASASTLDGFLVPRSQTSASKSISGPGQLDHMVAQGDVMIQQPSRRAEGQKLVYTSADDKFVLTGGPPSIFDAEQGKITGVSLTFFRRDDRVLVEGEASSPVVTTTRVAH